MQNTPVQLSWELSRAAVETPDGLRLILMARLEAAPDPDFERAPLNISMVLDRSGSMSGDKLQQCVHAARFAASQLSGSDQASVVMFDGHVDVLVNHGSVQKNRMMEELKKVT